MAIYFRVYLKKHVILVYVAPPGYMSIIAAYSIAYELF